MDTILHRVRSQLVQRRPRVLVIGDLMIDRSLWGNCERISPEAPVPVVEVWDRTTSLGGAGNVVANLVALGAETSVASVVGRDENEAHLMRMLGDLGAGTDCVVVEEGRQVTLKTRIVAAHQQVVRYDIESRRSISDASARDLVERSRAAMRDVDVVLLSDYGKGVLTHAVSRELIESARKLSKPIICDPKGADWSKYKGATTITPNKKEAAQVAGAVIDAESALRSVGEQLLSTYELSWLLITLSEQGMAFFDAQGCHRIPTVARDVYDVTGAGDTVIASLAFGLACGLEPLAACQLANVAAGVAVSKVGTVAVTLDQVAEAALSSRGRAAEKIKSCHDLAEICAQLRRRGRKIAFTNGCFDILHVGHMKTLEEAAALGDVLVVGVNTDASVARLKPGRPLNSEDDRARLLSAIEFVDFVVLFDEDTPLELISLLQPNVLVKGGDYRREDIVGAEVVLAAGGSVHTVALEEGQSTSQLLERLRELDS